MMNVYIKTLNIECKLFSQLMTLLAVIKNKNKKQNIYL